MFTWKERPVSHFEDGKKWKAEHNCKRWNTRYSNIKVGKPNKKTGYIQIGIKGKLYYGHRLAFLYMEGYMPENIVDHKDRNKANNKWNNLREASYTCNNQNTSKRADNTSGVAGVSWSLSVKKWHVYIQFNNKRKHLGYCVDFIDAVKMRYNEEQINPLWSCSFESSAEKKLKQRQLI